jgi:3-isopropylmalate dehydrogenase
MVLKVAVLAGDGIGPEIVEQAIKVIDAVSQRNGTPTGLHPCINGSHCH